MTQDSNNPMDDLLTRDGHLTELTVNRFRAREFEPDENAFIEEHLVGCSACSSRLDTIAKFDAQFSFEPPQQTPAHDEAPSTVVSLDAERARRLGGLSIVGLLAAAAAVALMIRLGGDTRPTVTPGDDDIRFKGSGLALEVFAKSDDRPARLVGDGDVVHPGDRLGFKVTTRNDGFLMIVGVDDSGQVYEGWPQQSAGKAEFVPAADGPIDLESAVRLDDVGSREKLVLARCPQMFDIAAVSKHLAGAKSLQKQPSRDPLDACVYDDVTLKKKAR